MQEFRSFKSFEANKQFWYSWMQDLETPKPVTLKSSVRMFQAQFICVNKSNVNHVHVFAPAMQC